MVWLLIGCTVDPTLVLFTLIWSDNLGLLIYTLICDLLTCFELCKHSYKLEFHKHTDGQTLSSIQIRSEMDRSGQVGKGRERLWQVRTGYDCFKLCLPLLRFVWLCLALLRFVWLCLALLKSVRLCFTYERILCLFFLSLVLLIFDLTNVHLTKYKSNFNWPLDNFSHSLFNCILHIYR